MDDIRIYKTKTIVHLTGPAGVGKKTFVRMLANEYGWLAPAWMEIDCTLFPGATDWPQLKNKMMDMHTAARNVQTNCQWMVLYSVHALHRRVLDSLKWLSEPDCPFTSTLITLVTRDSTSKLHTALKRIGVADSIVFYPADVKHAVDLVEITCTKLDIHALISPQQKQEACSQLDTDCGYRNVVLYLERLAPKLKSAAGEKQKQSKTTETTTATSIPFADPTKNTTTTNNLRKKYSTTIPEKSDGATLDSLANITMWPKN